MQHISQKNLVLFSKMRLSKKEAEKIKKHLAECDECVVGLREGNKKIIQHYQSRKVALSTVRQAKDMIRECKEPYDERQVWAASSLVPVELCIKCPYFKEGSPSINQLGTCCYCRLEANYYDMTGDALCMEFFTKS